MRNVERRPTTGFFFHGRRVLLIALLGVAATLGDAAFGGAAPTPPSAAELRQITVNALATTGRLRSLAGVNGAPAPGMHKPENFKFGGWNMPEQIDAARGYREAHIDLVRTHDAYGPGDIDSRFETNEAPGGALISAQRDVYTLFPDPNADPEIRRAIASARRTSSSHPSSKWAPRRSSVSAAAKARTRHRRATSIATRASRSTSSCTTTAAGPTGTTTASVTGRSGMSRIWGRFSGPARPAILFDSTRRSRER